MKRAGAYYKLLYHFTWATRDRLPMISPLVESRLFPYLQSKCKELGYTLHALDGTEDHLHLLIELTPSILVADVAKNLKGASSHYINKESGLPDTLYWQDGYGVVSLREGDAPSVATYIADQKRHHRAGNLSKVLETSTE